MLTNHADSAKKALSLRKDIVFHLLVLMMALLGWLCAVAGSGMVMLENAYTQWQLEQKSHISVYINADENRAEVVALVEELSSMKNVRRAYLLGENEVSEILQPYFDGETSFPLPFVIDATVSEKLDREYFNTKVGKYFDEASIDDARDLLSQVSYMLRFTQWIIVAIAVILLVVMAVLVSLTIRAGLRGKQKSLQTMQHIGATDGFLISLVTRQSWIQSLKGWLGGSILAGITVFALLRQWPSLEIYMSHYVWVAVVIIPFILAIVASISAWFTAKQIMRKLA
jgi:cell division protein FtsX